MKALSKRRPHEKFLYYLYKNTNKRFISPYLKYWWCFFIYRKLVR